MSDEYIVSRYDDGGRLVYSVHVPVEKGREKLEAWRRMYGAENVKGFIEDNLPVPGEIYPCPLCGGEPRIVEENFMPFLKEVNIKMTCPACGLTLGSSVNVFNNYDRTRDERERLINLWNRRSYNGKVLPQVIEKVIHIPRDW